VLRIAALFARGEPVRGHDGRRLWRGLDHEDAARFAFLVATPPILAAGLLKLPSVTGHCGE